MQQLNMIKNPWGALGQAPTQEDVNVAAAAGPPVMGPPSPTPEQLKKMKQAAHKPKAAAPVPPPTQAPQPVVAAPPPAPTMTPGMDTTEEFPAMPTRNYGQLPRGVAKKIGDHWASNIKDSAQSKAGENHSLWMTPEEMNGLLGAVEELPMVKQRREDMGNEALLNQRLIDAIPGGQDLSPLMALADAWGNQNHPTHLAQHYTPPITAAERAQLLMKYGDTLDKRKEEMMKTLLDTAKTMKAGNTSNVLTLGTVSGMEQGQKIPRPAQPPFMKPDEKYLITNNQKTLNDYQTSKSHLDAIDEALKIGTVGSVGRALAQAARELSGEKGVLTEQDVGRVLPRSFGRTMAEWEAYASSNPDVPLDPQILVGLQQAVQNAHARLKARYAERQQAFKDQVQGSQMYGNLPSVPKIMKPNDDIIVKDKPEDKPETLMDKFDKFIQSKQGNKK